MAKSVRDENVYKYCKISVKSLARIADIEDQIGLSGMSQVVEHCIKSVWNQKVDHMRKEQYV